MVRRKIVLLTVAKSTASFICLEDAFVSADVFAVWSTIRTLTDYTVNTFPHQMTFSNAERLPQLLAYHKVHERCCHVL